MSRKLKINYTGLIITAVVLFTLYVVYKKKFTPFAVASDKQEALNLKGSMDKMGNGRTYYSVADEILNHLYYISSLFAIFEWKDTDEIALGRLIQTVRADEIPKLSEVYLSIKKGIKADSRPLMEQLLKTFNNKEQQTYMSHLM